MEENTSVKAKIKAYLQSGKILTSCTASKEFLTADLRKYVSMLRNEGLKIADELVENGNKKRFKKYFIVQDGTV